MLQTFCNNNIRRYIRHVLAGGFSLLILGCGGGTSTEGPDPGIEDYPIAYVKRPHPVDNQGDPAQEACPELGKGEEEQQPRGDRQPLVPPARQRLPPSRCSSSALKEERTKTPEKTRAKPRPRAVCSSSWKRAGGR